MPCYGFDGWFGEGSKLKVWRYPGVPIPHRLSFKYYDPTVKKRK